MKLLVTGAGGLLGKASVLAGETRKHHVVGLSRQELDVSDPAAVEEAVRRSSPDAVLHCAAFTDVDGAERDPEAALRVNRDGAENVARSARERGARLVLVSTDYVFAGDHTVPYTESDPTNPVSSYGRSKLEGERRVRRMTDEDALIVRTGWLYGAGKGFPDWFLAQIEREVSVRLIDDQFGSPTWASDLAWGILLLVENCERGTFHFVNKGETHWLGAGRAIAERLGVDVRLEPASMADWARPARRPRYSVLDVRKFESRTATTVPSWQDALTRYLASVGRNVNTATS